MDCYCKNDDCFCANQLKDDERGSTCPDCIDGIHTYAYTVPEEADSETPEATA